jgi:hypothetical protein
MTGMRVASALSTQEDAIAAVDDIARQLGVTGGREPDFVALHFAPVAALDEVQGRAAERFGAAALHGGSSCRGVMTEAGLAMRDGRGMGALAIWDPGGAYGTAMAELGTAPRDAARQAAHAALQEAGRAGEAPELVWLTGAPGAEEQVLAGLKDVLGPDALIVGGSAADNDVSGRWQQLCGAGTAHAAIVVSVLFPSGAIACSYQSGYAPTGIHGTVTRCEGRRLVEIDGKPAADIYARWTGGAVPAAPEADRSILAESTFHPLGRETDTLAGVPFHLLAHPAVAHPDGALSLFADVAPGETLWLMEGSAESLVARAGRVAAASREDLPEGAVSGALVVYCGGCMLAVEDRMEDVRRGVAERLGGAPFLGVFTFGEQGAPLGGETRHGNLMISCSGFGQGP